MTHSTKDQQARRCGRAVRPSHRRALLLAAAVVAITALSGCGSGQITQTGSQVPAVSGAEAGNGPVVVRDAQIIAPDAGGPDAYPPGSTAPVQMRIINQGERADRLVSASSPAATAVDIRGDTALAPGETIVVTGQAPAASNEAAPGAPAAGATRAAGTRPTGQAQIGLAGLTEAIRPGLDYPLTLEFQHAGPITLALPVGPSPKPGHGRPGAG